MKYELNTNGVYEITNFDMAMQECKDFIEREGNLDLVIQTDEDKKLVKKSRTAIRKKKEQIADLRIQLSKAVLGMFNGQAKELEKMLDEADKKLKQKIVDYEAKPADPEIYTITITSYNKGDIAKIRTLAMKLRCGIKE